ncbi:lipase family protein [Xanthomonas axonopodis]|uniref:Lipase n=1 Tax=Xanthomonas axonopodis pv. vasculorum TaxID=325777 RepID=A0A098Q076_9XANT|nr:lipase [Xanthomonas axonopodis]KGE52725.1 lipase [Xanthomonas axonopodis pv. vasculorum]
MSLTIQQYAFLARDVYDKPQETGENSKHVEIGGAWYKRLEYIDSPSGYQGIIYRKIDTGEIVVAHRGSEFDRQPGQDGLLADGGMVVTRHNAQAADAIELTRHAMNMAEREAKRDGHRPEVTVTGHSLGGGLAQVTAHHYGLQGETFNAYGAVSLDRRIPEGGSDVINHVMAGDAVSAASQHYGQVRVYATPQEIAFLQQAGYDNTHSMLDARDPLVAVTLGDAHRMHNFLPVDGHGKPDRSVLEDPAARQLAQQYAPMVVKYRHDVQTLRSGVTLEVRGLGGLLVDGIDTLRGPEAPGAGRRAMHAPTWSEQMQALNTQREHTPASQQSQHWHAPLQPSGRATQAQPLPSLQDDPGAFLDRMLQASANGERALFRQLTQELANQEPGRALRVEAIATVDRQERQAAQQALQAQQQAEQQHAAQRGRG